MMAIMNARRDTIRATKEIESEFKWRGILVVVVDDEGEVSVEWAICAIQVR